MFASCAHETLLSFCPSPHVSRSSLPVILHWARTSSTLLSLVLPSSRLPSFPWLLLVHVTCQLFNCQCWITPMHLPPILHPVIHLACHNNSLLVYP
jgi:hypothetical protein